MLTASDVDLVYANLLSGYGWGISVFGFLALAIAPAPVIFYYFGAKLREKYWIDLDN